MADDKWKKTEDRIRAQAEKFGFTARPYEENSGRVRTFGIYHKEEFQPPGATSWTNAPFVIVSVKLGQDGEPSYTVERPIEAIDEKVEERYTGVTEALKALA